MSSHQNPAQGGDVTPPWATSDGTPDTPASVGVHRAEPSKKSPLFKILGAIIAVGAIGTATVGSFASAHQGDSLRTSMTIVAPAGAGGGWDTVAREMQQAQRANGIVNNTQVVNMPGAGGTIALGNLANLEGDPSTLMVGGTGQLAATIQYDTDTTYADITPLAITVEEYNMVVVPADSPYQSLEELMTAWAADPASVPWSGGGSFDRLVATELATVAGVDPKEMVFVSSDGGGEVTAALLNGTVQAAASGFSDSIDQVESGRLRALGLVSKERFEGVDIPTTVEQGYDVTLSNWRLLAAPGGLTAEEEAELTDIVLETVETEEWSTAVGRYNWAERVITGDELDVFLEEEKERISSLYESLGV